MGPKKSRRADRSWSELFWCRNSLYQVCQNAVSKLPVGRAGGAWAPSGSRAGKPGRGSGAERLCGRPKVVPRWSGSSLQGLDYILEPLEKAPGASRETSYFPVFRCPTTFPPYWRCPTFLLQYLSWVQGCVFVCARARGATRRFTDSLSSMRHTFCVFDGFASRIACALMGAFGRT